ASARPLHNACCGGASLFGEPAARYPMTGIAVRCARADSGQVATPAPAPSALMNSRRLIAPSTQDKTIAARTGALEEATSQARAETWRTLVVTSEARRTAWRPCPRYGPPDIEMAYFPAVYVPHAHR